MGRAERLRNRAAQPATTAPGEQVFQIKGGRAVPVVAPSFSEDGFAPYTGTDVVDVPGLGRVVLYPDGNAVKPWPLSRPVIAEPGSFRRLDFQNLVGKYMVHLAREALAVDEEETVSWGTIVLMIIGGLGVVVSGCGAYYAWKAMHIAAGIHGGVFGG